MQKPDISIEFLGEMTVLNGQGEPGKLSSLWEKTDSGSGGVISGDCCTSKA